ncbi:amidase [Stappia sp. MMSF_3263]|uniref:amidase n=1 Tax=Stappia sp. MMSF_3263 TaxID=3046693 RepID=UPI00273D2B26|nr:amidase [Stappia sp. MMSF_3263]
MLSALELAKALHSGSRRLDDVYREIAERVEIREPDVRAFVVRDVEAALRAGQAATGPLMGLPMAIKDNIDTGDMPTAYGSPIHKDHRPAVDAAIVALARRAGAAIIGKTVTTEFAFFQPGPTRNPGNLDHTPGGSSSGSAAGIAAGFFPLALGTQTGGSVVRPAAFCGIAGFKPSFGHLPVVGVKIFSWTLDTLGLFGKGIADVAFGAGILAGRDWRVDTMVPTPPRIGLIEPQPWAQADDDMLAALDTARALAERAGAPLQRVSLPPVFREAFAAHKVIQDYEATRALAAEFDKASGMLSPVLRETLQEGATIDAEAYDAAQEIAAQARRAQADLMSQVDVLMMPSAPGAAPAGLASTGSSVFNRVWTLMGAPAVNVPGLHNAAGLPLGIQLVGAYGRDRATLQAAHWLEGNFVARGDA